MAITLNHIYTDSNIFIAALNPEPLTLRVKTLLEQAEAEKIILIGSVLSYGEVLNTGQSKYTNAKIFLDSVPVFFCAISKNTILKAAELRQNSSGLKLPDAIHLATAIEQKCDIFITEDKKLLTIAKKHINSSSLADFKI